MSIRVIWNFPTGGGWPCPSTRRSMPRGTGAGAAGAALLENDSVSNASVERALLRLAPAEV
jgi:hypothetical protein